MNTLKSAGRSALQIGITAGILSAALFALNLTFARLAYRFDTSVHALNLTRSVLLFVALWLFCRVRGVPILPERNKLVALGIVGLLMAAQLFTLVGALEHAQVGLVLIVFFTYPLIVTSVEHVLLRRLPSGLLIACLFATLTGLYFVLGSDFSSISVTGLLLAIAAAGFFAGLVMTSSRSMDRMHPAVVMLWMMLVTSLTTGLVAIFSEVSWPGVSAGWLALAVSAVLFCVATVLFFLAIHFLGPMPAAVIDNTAPVWGMIWGLLVLGEQLAPRQIIGGLIVVGAVIAAQLAMKQRDRFET